MSNRLGGKQGTAYLGTNANQPPNWTFSDRDPGPYDINNVSLGDMWLNELNQDVWILVSLAGNAESKGSLATWVRISNAGIGILNSLTGNTGGAVFPDGASNINFVGDGVGITITGNPGTSTLTASLVGGGEAAQSFTTDMGTAIPNSGAMNIIANNAAVNAGSSVLFTGVGNTVTLNVTDSNDNTIIGRASGNLTLSGGDNTILGEQSGISLTSGSDNTIIGGSAGFGITSGSNNIIIGSQAGGIITTTDSSNTLIGASGFAGATDLTVIASGASGDPILHNFPGTNASTSAGGNTFVGANAGNFTLAGAAGEASNNGFGQGSLSGLTTGSNNNAIGVDSLSLLTTGSFNTAIGDNAGFDPGGPAGLTTGSFNILVGNDAGITYGSSESSNIIIGNNGVPAENNTIRLGTNGSSDGSQNRCFVGGIFGVTPDSADGIPVYIGSDNQLGTVGNGGSTLVSTLTGNSGGAVGPASGNINIVGDGTTIQITGNPGTNTLTVVGLGGGGGDLSILTGDSGSATAAGGTINVITDNAAQGSGSSVLFTGASDTLTLSVTDGDNNTIIGQGSGNATLTGTQNTVLGSASAVAFTTASANTIIGHSAGASLLTGGTNVLVGITAGSNYTTSESNNILINNLGTAADGNALRIGSATGTGTGQLNKAFIAGIRGITPATTDGIPVFIGSAGQLGTVGNGGTTMVQTITGNAGGAVGPASGNINIVGDGTTIQITGNPGTNTLTVVGLGGGGGDLSILAGDVGIATAAGGTINVVTNNSAQGSGSSVLFTGSSDDLVLTVTDAGSNTLIGNATGNATHSGTNNTALGKTCGAALTTGSSNVFLGVQAGSLVTTGTGNFLCGNGALATVLQGQTTSTGLYAFGASTGLLFLHNWGGAVAGNTFVGYGSGNNFSASQQTSNRNNTAIGINSLQALTTGSTNVALGRGTGSAITTGTGNTVVGNLAGSNYVSSESNNILINNLGTAAESNTLRIAGGTGTGTGQVNRAFISGIRGVTTGISNAIPVVIDSAGQLGTAGGSSVMTTLTANSGGAVSPTGGNINIVGDGTSVNIVGNPGTSTLTVSAVGGTAGPSFVAYLATDYTFTEAEGLISPFPFDTVPVNVGSAFNTGTYIFTAPVTGLYSFSCHLLFGDTSATIGTSQVLQLVTTSTTYQINNTPKFNTASGYTSVGYGGTFLTQMTAGDTARITFQRNLLFGTPQPVVKGISTISPSTNPGINTFFSGTLV